MVFKPGASRRDARFGFRVTAVPAGAAFSLPRLYGNISDFRLQTEFKASISWQGSTKPVKLHIPHSLTSESPLVRGVRICDRDGRLCLRLYADGAVDLVMGFVPSQGKVRLYPIWIAAAAMNVLRAASYLRTRADAVESEYAVGCEILSQALQTVTFCQWSTDYIGTVGNFTAFPLVLPRLSFGPMSDVHAVLSAIAGDLIDATGEGYAEIPSIQVDGFPTMVMEQPRAE